MTFVILIAIAAPYVILGAWALTERDRRKKADKRAIFWGAEKIDAELRQIDLILSNARGFDGCATRVEKIALMLETLRVRNVLPIDEPATPSAVQAP